MGHGTEKQRGETQRGPGFNCRTEPDALSTPRQRARRYPIARWYLSPAADRLATLLAPTRVRPVHLTFCGLLSAVGAAAVLLWRPEAMPVAAALVLAYWFFDRADGLLARRQQTVSAWGAWLDGSVDELVDVGLHAAAAAVVAWQVDAVWPWYLLAAMLGGKHLLMYGLALEEHAASYRTTEVRAPLLRSPTLDEARDNMALRLFRAAYHLPANADVRVHLLILALATGWLSAELAWVAAYYNLRWAVRYLLVWRRLGGRP